MLVVLGHGLTSDKERPWSEALSEGLAKAGIASMRIAFSGNGESEGSFLDSTITKEVRDLRAVIDAVEADDDATTGQPREFAYVGHSMGAAVGVLAAVSDPRIRALVSLAGMVHTLDFAMHHFGSLKEGEMMLDKPGKPLGAALLNDMETLDTVVNAGTRVEVPWLIVHGDADDVVPIRDSSDIHAAAAGRSGFVSLPNVDHSFNGPGLRAMTSVVLPWLIHTLS